jgi:hypothetical protein
VALAKAGSAMSRSTIEALETVVVAAAKHLEDLGPCDNAEDGLGDSLCDNPGCTYCLLARAMDSLPEEMKP